jgi:sugar lactone lactonase YvrE|tara:strand:- start:2016 stop:2801 length:786 start_codon:yes stop_codon:yes gene_type:complete
MVGDGLAVDSTGNIFIPSGFGDPTVWKIASDGALTEFASGYQSAVGIAIDSQDNLFVNDYRGNALTMITPAGVKTDFATQLNGPAGVAIDSQGNIYVTLFGANFSGTGASIIRFTPEGVQSPFASGAPLRDIIGIAIDDADNVYVSNWVSGNLYKISAGTTTPVLFATIPDSANINQITYSKGYIYVPTPNEDKIYRVDLAGNIELLAGVGTRGLKNGPALESTFGGPNSAGANAAGDTLYVVDATLNNLRAIDLGCPTPG